MYSPFPKCCLQPNNLELREKKVFNFFIQDQCGLVSVGDGAIGRMHVFSRNLSSLEFVIFIIGLGNAKFKWVFKTN